MKSIIGVLVDAKANQIRITRSKPDIQWLYDNLDCDLFDIATRCIGGKYYDIYCDDEGLLKEPKLLSAISHRGVPMLVGNLFIVNTSDDEGYSQSLTKQDIENIMDNIVQAIVGDDFRKLIVCDYEA